MSDWHGVVLPASVCRPLEEFERAMRAALADRAAPARRLLLWGAPGVGKTEIRRALVREGSLPGIETIPRHLSGSYIGTSLAAVKEVFERARSAEPSLLSIDAFDTCFPCDDGSAQSSERLLAMLQELDSRSPARVFIVGETNDPRLVNQALLKRGFELLKVPVPDEAGRAEILRQAFRKVPLAAGFDLDETAGELAALLRGSPGRNLVGMVRRGMERAVQEAFDRREDPADAVLTRDLLLADETVRASGVRCPSAGDAHS